MQTKQLRQIIFTLLMGVISVAAFGNSINAQKPENRRREDKEKKKDDRKEAEKEKLMQEWFSSPENRKKILEEKARKEQQENERKKAELERAKRRAERQQRRRDFRRDSIFDDDESCEEVSEQTETENSYIPKKTYADLYEELQSAAAERENYLQEQNRLTLFEYQKEYFARLESDNLLLKKWKSSAKNQSKNYRYVSRGTVRHTSQAGTEMIYRAINLGYERGILIGRADLQDIWQYDPENSYIYQDAIYGYDGYDIDLTEYRFYFQQGFWRGYEDGFYRRFIYGKQENDKFIVLETIMPKIVEFKS